MKIKMKELLASSNSLARIGALELNTALKFRLGRVIKQAGDALNDFNKAKDELVKKLGGKLENEKLSFPNPAAETQADKEYAELLAEEIELKFDSFSEKSFEKLEIASSDIANVLWLFGDGEETPEEEKNNNESSSR